MVSTFSLEYFSDRFGAWTLMGSLPTSAEAQRHMADWREIAPRLPLRVVERPSGRLIVLNDPRPIAA